MMLVDIILYRVKAIKKRMNKNQKTQKSLLYLIFLNNLGILILKKKNKLL